MSAFELGMAFPPTATVKRAWVGSEAAIPAVRALFGGRLSIDVDPVIGTRTIRFATRDAYGRWEYPEFVIDNVDPPEWAK